MMRSYNEKLAIIKKSERDILALLPKLVADVQSGDIRTMSEVADEYGGAGMPVMQMYADELSEALSPTSNLVIPFLLVTLESYLNCLKEQHKEAAKLAEVLKSGISAMHLEIDIGGIG